MRRSELSAMRAASYNHAGPARDVLMVGLRPEPLPGKGEVRVKLMASGVNPADVKTRAGAPGRVMNFPEVIPHSDGAGLIDQVGEGVDPERVNERVWLWNAQWQRPFGTAAEFVVVPEQQAVRLSSETSFEDGACLGIPAMTAYHAVHCDDDVRGKWLLVAGGAGSVGHYAIQMAKAAGARVVATVSSQKKADEALEAGAEAAFNYKSTTIVEEIRGIARDGIDRIIEVDLGANGHLVVPTLRYGGTVLVYGSASNMNPSIPVLQFGSLGVVMRFMSIYTISSEARHRAIHGITSLLEAGKLVHRIAASFSLDEVADAHEAVESGKMIGNVVLRI